MKTALLLLMLANAADAGLTMRNRGQLHSYELDPLMRPGFHAGPPVIGAQIAAGSVVEWMVVRRLEKHHHSRMAKVAVGAALAGEAWGITTSARDTPRPPR